MTAKTYLYRRPKHSVLQLADRDPETGTIVIKGAQQVSAFAGIDMAVRGISMGNGQLHESLRILRKIEKASHREVELHPLFIEFTEAEKKIIETSVNSFDWSKLSVNLQHDLWIKWTDFLAGFDSEDEIYATTWAEFDPLNPSAEYATWKLQYASAVADYNAKVAAAEAAAALPVGSGIIKQAMKAMQSDNFKAAAEAAAPVVDAPADA